MFYWCLLKNFVECDIINTLGAPTQPRLFCSADMFMALCSTLSPWALWVIPSMHRIQGALLHLGICMGIFIEQHGDIK